MQKADLQNLLVFMKRVQMTGEEALAWTQTYAAVNQELAALSPPPAPPVPPAV
jgi:hypothetical protein